MDYILSNHQVYPSNDRTACCLTLTIAKYHVIEICTYKNNLSLFELIFFVEIWLYKYYFDNKNVADIKRLGNLKIHGI